MSRFPFKYFLCCHKKEKFRAKLLQSLANMQQMHPTSIYLVAMCKLAYTFTNLTLAPSTTPEPIPIIKVRKSYKIREINAVLVNYYCLFVSGFVFIHRYKTESIIVVIKAQVKARGKRASATNFKHDLANVEFNSYYFKLFIKFDSFSLNSKGAIFLFSYVNCCSRLQTESYLKFSVEFKTAPMFWRVIALLASDFSCSRSIRDLKCFLDQ